MTNKIFFHATTTILATLMISCGEEQKSQVATTYNTITVREDSAIVCTEYSAVLRGSQIVEVRPQVGGVITQILVNEGATVDKGQTMFIIDQVPYQAALANAKAQVKSAEASVANAKLTLESKSKLLASGIISDFDVQQAQNNYDEALAALENARATLLNAENNLSYTEVKSPAAGSIGMIPYRVGALVSSSISEPLTVVSDSRKVNAYFSISESDYQQMVSRYGSGNAAIKNYPAVQLMLCDGSKYSISGIVDAVSGNVDSETGAVSLRATFDNPDGVLQSGGSATIIVPKTIKGIIIPQESTYELQEKVFVYKVVEGKTKSTQIYVSEVNDGTSYAVISGLECGDVIIAEGAGLLREGLEVNVSQSAE